MRLTCIARNRTLILAVCALIAFSPAAANRMAGLPEDAKPLMQLAEKHAAEGDAGAAAIIKSLHNKATDAEARAGIEWVIKMARAGHAAAQHQWAFTLEATFPERASEIAQWYQRAADQGFAMSQNNLANLYLTGRGVEKNLKRAVEFSRAAAEQGIGNAAARLGTLYETGDGVPLDGAEAVRWHEKAAAAGHAGSHTALFYLYGMGKLVPRDAPKAAEWLKKAAELGEPNAIKLFIDNRAKVPIDASVPTPVVKKAIELGDTTAQYVWAMRLQTGGHGTVKDMDESLRWLKTAAEAGQADAQAQLGYQYLFGTGVAKNEAEGVKWTRKAAATGNATGLANMGAVYLFGWGGVKRDEKLAGYQFLQAANRKHPRALQLLGE
ncbi:MAG: sel1 repeat family protein [Betaproteobacteria bacterium]|nr:sel1 repeat family protein [Betaproteobacteria bacterium]